MVTANATAKIILADDSLVTRAPSGFIYSYIAILEGPDNPGSWAGARFTEVRSLTAKLVIYMFEFVDMRFLQSVV
jgi:hypothetical protein